LEHSVFSPTYNEAGNVALLIQAIREHWFPKAAGRHWPRLMDMHLYYFTEESIRNILKQTGFEIIDERKYCHVATLE
jgi:hypothetical protein